MYAVVGCGECTALWIVADEPERSQCPRCHTTRPFEARRKFFTTDDEREARQARSALLAAEADQEEALAQVGSFGELAAAAEDAGIDDERYLEGMGLDPEAIETAGTDCTSAGGESRRDVIVSALDSLEEPTERELVEYAADRDVPPEYTEATLTKLERRGVVSQNRGVYRLL